MKTFSNITWGLFVISAIAVLLFWYRDYRSKDTRFNRREILVRTILIVLMTLFALLSLVSTELAAGKDLRSAVQNELLWILPDVLFVDVPYLYMVISRREKRDEFNQT